MIKVLWRQYLRVKDGIFNKSSENKFETKWRVSQGSVLCPVLFIMHINDLAKASKLQLIMFVDDKTLINLIYSRVFLSDLIMPWRVRTGIRVAFSAPSLNSDRKMLLTWNLAHPYLAILKKKKKTREKFFNIATIRIMMWLIMSIFLKNYAING